MTRMMTPNQRSDPRSVTTDRCQALGAPRRHSSLGALISGSLTQANCAAGTSVPVSPLDPARGAPGEGTRQRRSQCQVGGISRLRTEPTRGYPPMLTDGVAGDAELSAGEGAVLVDGAVVMGVLLSEPVVTSPSGTGLPASS